MIAIEYSLTRSRRKSIAVYVRNGGVEVRAPLNAPKHVIDEFVASKAQWIREKQAFINERQAQRERFTLTYGDLVTYRGKLYPITAKDGNHAGFTGATFYMPPDLPPDQIKSACIQVYRMLAKRDMTAKTLEFAQLMRVSPSAVKINGAKTRWGSCSSKKSLNFSWRLIMAQDDLIDYVVVHELAHISEMNHSERFWAVVEAVLPDYRERKARLHALQQKLSIEDWD